jgi:hypothetical protein
LPTSPSQSLDDRQEVGRSRGVQELGANGDLPRLGERESMDGHDSRIPTAHPEG